MNVVFFGSSKFVIPIIEVIRKNFDLALVITTEKLPTDAVSSYCIKSRVRYYVVTDFRNKKIINKIKEANPDIGILASFGAIVPKSVLDVFKFGILNIHPSLLPKYRGPTPVQTAILNGDKTTGVTIIKLDEEVDHGPILKQVEKPIFENDTSESLYDRLFRVGASSIVDTIKLYVKGRIIPREQDHSKATFTKRLTRQDGHIDLSSLENGKWKMEIARKIRAYYPWPSVWTRYVTGPDLVKEKIIKFLPGEKIQVEGKKPVDIETLKRGYPNSIKWLEKLFGR